MKCTESSLETSLSCSLVNKKQKNAHIQSQHPQPPFHTAQRLRLFAGGIVFYHDMLPRQGTFIWEY